MNKNIEIFNEDCFATMDRMAEKSIDIVLTSPPYNTTRLSQTGVTTINSDNVNTHHYSLRYDSYSDSKTTEEYCDWTVELFNKFNKVLKKDGIVLYNMSYGSSNTEVMFLAVAEILRRTPFTIADCIVWKKDNALPNNVSPNKLTRITELVFVFCRKDDFQTFTCNKKVVSTRPTGQKMYENIFNFIEARNNDGSCPINKATYSSELCIKLLTIYSKKNAKIYDPFMGTGTTAVACLKMGLKCVGSELSNDQVEYSWNRIKAMKEYHTKSLF